ncbi:MAG: biotin--[acetyl-CoA-carboxylase] ligase [Chlamydiae bacterium]|nr:biotin--[acetyl-CoA-carboxylase] ligase [Chlamydiota bacterium]
MDFIDIVLEKVDSTQTFAKKTYKTYDPKKITCILALEQTKGRGRFNRHWLSPKGENLYVTFYFQLSKENKSLTAIGLILAIFCARVMSSYGLNPKIKWPNDVILNNKKVAGILSEVEFEKDIANIFLGIGINVNTDKTVLEKIDQPATSIKHELKKELSGAEILEKIKKEFSKDWDKFIKEGFLAFHEEFEKFLAFKKEKIKVFDGQNYFEGILDSISFDGQLNLLMPNQKIKRFSSGDIQAPL